MAELTARSKGAFLLMLTLIAGSSLLGCQSDSLGVLTPQATEALAVSATPAETTVDTPTLAAPDVENATPTTAPSVLTEPERTVEGWAVLAGQGWAQMASYGSGHSLVLWRLHSLLELMGWKESHIRELHGEFGESDVQESIEWLASNADNDDLVLFYLAGHAGYMRRQVRWSDFFGKAWSTVPSWRRVLIVDSCNAGEFAAAVQDSRPHLSIGAVSADEGAWAGTIEEGLPVLGIVFGHFFVSASIDPTADMDGNHVISIQEATSHANRLQSRYMRDVVWPSYPDFASRFMRDGVLIEGAHQAIVHDSIGQPVYLDLGAYDLLDDMERWRVATSSVVCDDCNPGSIAVSPDGSKLAIAGITPRLLEAATGDPIRDLEASDVRHLAWSPDGLLVASAGNDGMIRVNQASDGSLGYEYEIESCLEPTIAWSQDGTQLAAACLEDPAVRVWEPAGPNGIRILGTHESGVSSLAWHPKEPILASAGGMAVILWDVAAGRNLGQFESPGVASVAWSPDGTRLATGGFDGGIQVWSYPDKRQLCLSAVWYQFPNTIAWSSDGVYLASIWKGDSVRLWDAATCRMLATLAGRQGMIAGLSLHPSEDVLFTSGDDLTIRKWVAP